MRSFGSLDMPETQHVNVKQRFATVIVGLPRVAALSGVADSSDRPLPAEIPNRHRRRYFVFGKNLSMFQINTVPSRSPLTVCRPFPANAARTTGEPCLPKTPTSLPLLSCQSRTVASAPAVSAHFPFADSATDRTAPSCPASV